MDIKAILGSRPQMGWGGVGHNDRDAKKMVPYHEAKM